MIHESGRKIIRDTAVATLIRANTLAGANVFPSRTWPLQEGEGAALLVYTNSENSDSKNMASPDAHFRTTLELMIIIRCDGSQDSIENELDTVIEQVKNALFTDVTFRDLNDWFSGMRTELTFKDNEAESVGAAVITINCVYDEQFAADIQSDYLGANIYVDAGSVAVDTQGTYDSIFPIAAAPRTSGPDGRIEVYVEVDPT